jgi:hypothetical protein
MIRSNSDLNESLTGGGGGGGDDSASQSSQRSGASLLERIQAQRNREAAQAGTGNAVPTQQIQVPQYDRVAQQENGDGDLGNSSFFSNAWNNISESMENGMASLQVAEEGDGMDDALLAPSSNHGDREYSMTGYFTTFIMDVYNMFLSLPVWGRGIIVIVLLYIAIKLL